MKIPAFGPWSEQDHIGEKQAGMLARAQFAETSPLPGSVDPINQTATFYGSKLYEVSLAHCPCGGFRGKFPCKHIYRLAMELGIIDLPYKTGISKGEFNETQLSLKDAIQEFEKLSLDTQWEAYNMLAREKEHRHRQYLMDDPDIIAEFRACPLFEEHNPIPFMLSQLKRVTLCQIAECSGVPNPPKKNASSAVISQWLLDHVPNLSDFLPPYAAFSYISAFDRAQPSAIKWFNQKESYKSTDYDE